jgi:hypothetical protein
MHVTVQFEGDVVRFLKLTGLAIVLLNAAIIVTVYLLG